MRNEWEFNYEVTVLMSSSLLVKAYGVVMNEHRPPCFDMLSLSPRLIPVHFAPPWHMITGLHMRTAYILRASTSFVIRFWMSRNRHACVVCPLSKITRLVTAGFVCVQSNCQGHQCSVDRELWERSSLEFSTQSDGSLRLHCCMLQLSTFRYVLSHQQSRASHFPVAGFPFPHIQPPSTACSHCSSTPAWGF